MVVIAKIIGEAAIRLRAESKTLGPEIRRLVTTAIKQAAAGIKQDTQTDTNGITDGIRRDAEKTGATVKSIIGNIGSSLSFVNKAFVQTTLKAVTLSVVIGGLASSLSGTAALVGGLGEAISGMGAAAAGVGVAGLTALLALSTTLKIATSGMGDAFKAVAEGDAKALQEALKGMAPAARSFVTETAKLKPIFDDIKLSTQAALFKDLGTEVLATGKALGSTFKGLFVGIATQVNEAGKQVLKFLREARTVDDLGKISENVTGGFREMSQAARSIVQVIVDIVKSSSELLPDLGRSIEDITKKFAAFIRLKSDSGELTQFFRDGIETTKQFARTIRDVGVAISNIFKIASGTGGGFLAFLEDAAKRFRAFTESFQGQLIIADIVSIIRDLSGSFGVFLQALKPVLPVVADFARLLASTLGRILEELGPTIAELATVLLDTLGEVLPILTPFVIDLAKGIGQILQAVAPLLVPLAKLLAALTPLIKPLTRLVEAVVPPLIPLIEDVTRVVGFLAKGLGIIVDVIANVINAFSNLGRAIELAANPFDTFQKMLGIKPLGDDVKKGFRQLGHDAMEAIEEGLDGKKFSLFDSLRGTIDGMLNVFAFSEKGAEDAGVSFMQAVDAGFSSQDGLFNSTVNRILGAILGIFSGKQPDFATQGGTLGRAFSTGFTAEQARALEAGRRAVQAVLDAIAGKKPEFESEGRAIAQRLGGGISSGGDVAVGAARSISFQLAGVFGGVSLFGEGAAIMSSLRQGLVSGIQAVRNVLTSMTSLIPTWKGPESLDRKLLVPAGKAIMGGLIRSIRSEIPTLRSTLAVVTEEVATALNPLDGISPDFSTGAAQGAAGAVRASDGGTFVLQQTNNMLPGADVNQFAAEVWRRGAQDLTSGNSTLGVSQKPIQAGLAAPGSFVTVGA